MKQLSEDEFLEILEEFLFDPDGPKPCFDPAFNFLVQNAHRQWETKDVRKKLADMQTKKKPSKEEMATFCAWFYTHQEVMESYLASFSPGEKKLVTEATWLSSVSLERMNELFGIPVVQVVRKNRHMLAAEPQGKLERWKAFIQYNNIWYAVDEKDFLARAQPHLQLPLVLRRAFSRILPKPDGYYLKAYKLQGDETVFSAEKAIFRELPLIITHYLQGNIRYSQKGYPILSSCNKMNRALQLLEFPGNNEPGLRAMLLSLPLHAAVTMETASVPPLEILRQLFSDPEEDCSIPVLLDYLKGARNLHPYECDREATLTVLEVCSQMNQAGWIGLKNIEAYLDTHFLDFAPLPFYYAGKLTYEKRGRRLSIEQKDLEQHVTRPALAGYFYWLAAFGLAELAIDCHDPCPYSWYDGLRACRLTSLGAYVLGIQKEYTPPKSDNDVKLSFDEHNLVIVAEGNVRLADTMLSNYAVRAGGNHYQLSPGKFLKDCRSEADLKKKIALFKRTVGDDLPPFWENSLKRMRENSRAISPKKEMRIYELPADDRELHRLVAQDPQLRPFIIKAEKFHVLVAESDASRFTERMKELGYLIG